MGDSYGIGQFEFTKNVTISETGTEVQIRPVGGTNEYSGTLTVPSCETGSGSSGSGDSGLVCPDSTDKVTSCPVGATAVLACNGTVTCMCTETGLSCTCSSSSITPSEEEDEVVKPGNEAFKLIVPFDWNEVDKYQQIQFEIGNLIEYNGSFYITTNNGPVYNHELTKNIEESKAYSDRKFIVKLDLSRSNRVQYDESNESKHWRVWEDGEWKSASAVRQGNVVYFDGSIYVARYNNSTRPNWDGWGWIKVTARRGD